MLTENPVLPTLESPRERIAAAADPAAIAAVLKEERERIRAENTERPAGRATCRSLSERNDWAIQRLFELAGGDSEGVASQIAIVATGGYGRRELSPFSDVDVTFIVEGEEDEAVDQSVRRMFLWLMELFSRGLQLKVGYGYRTLTDLPQIDPQSQTALLDARLLAGSHAVFDRFTTALRRQIWPAAFVREKVAERGAARAKHGDTVYRIEPNVRDGCGGLRDIHLAEWLANVAFPTTRGDVWKQLQRLGAVSRRDVAQVQAAREFLLMVRNQMHFLAGRPADPLVRERQEQVATALDYQEVEDAVPVQRFMAEYYQHAEHVARVTGFVADRILAERLSLTEDLAATGGELAPAYPWVDVATPAFLVGLCEEFQRHGLVPGLELRRMIAEHPSHDAITVADREAAQRLVALLQERGKVADTLELLASLGVLQRWLPEVGQAFRRVPFETAHQYSVGRHSLQAVRSLERLRESEGERLDEFRRIWSEVEAPELLFLGALLHDVGKLRCAPGHAVQGAELTAGICDRLGLDVPEAAKVVALVLHHLRMSETAQLRDLTQDQTIRDFISLVDNRDLLNMLTLLTYADLEATGALSPMKVRFLLDLYYRAEAALAAPDGHPLLTGADEAQLQKYRTRLSRQLSAANLSPEQIHGHCEGMPVAYLLNTPPDRIAAHIRLVAALKETGRPVVEFGDDPGADVTTLTLCTFDTPEPGLLSRVAGVLYAQEVGVLAARVFTRETPPAIALDTLWIDFHGRQVPPIQRLEIEQALIRILAGDPVDDLIARHRKHLPPALAPHAIRFDNEAAEHHTVLDVEAPNQPALLYRLARAIASLGWDIHSAKISTNGDRARDAFYLTNAAGQRLLDDHAHLEARFLQAFLRD